MELQVIGAGVGRTGTNSLRDALELLLGGRCHHMLSVLSDPRQQALWADRVAGRPVAWEDIFDGYVAQVDWPGAAYWRELAAAYPDAKVLLSTREPDEWYRSFRDTIAAANRAGDGGFPFRESLRTMFTTTFCADLGDREAVIAAYRAHNAAVRAAVPADRLIDWTPTDGWGPICRALGVPVPDRPFPMTNTTSEFRARAGMAPMSASERSSPG